MRLIIFQFFFWSTKNKIVFQKLNKSKCYVNGGAEGLINQELPTGYHGVAVFI